MGPSGEGRGGAGVLVLRLGPFKLIRGDPGRPDGWVPPEEVTDQEETLQQEQHEGQEEQVLLFNLDLDPEERVDLAQEFPAITSYLCRLLDSYQATMVPPDLGDLEPGGNPARWQGLWSSGWCQEGLERNGLV